MRVSKRQKGLALEIENLIKDQGLSVDQIMKEENSDARTAILELAKDQIIRGQIIFDYALIDEALNAMIRSYFFGKNVKKNKKMKSFDNDVLEKLYILNKLEIAEKYCKFPSLANTFIRELNRIRNGLAHSLSPEELKTNKPLYKGKSVYDIEGLNIYHQDMDKVFRFLTKKAWGLKDRDLNF